MKRWLAGISLVGMMTLSVPSVWAADGLQRPQTGNPQHSTTTDIDPGTKQQMHHMEVRSSVQVSQDTLREAFEASRQAYTKKLQKYAKCSAKDAEKAVHTVHPGMKITDLELRTIRRSLVYISRTEDDDAAYLVIVDAGNGKVLMDRMLQTHHEKVFANK